MALNHGINVRLDPAIRERLEAIAARTGIKSSVLIRQALVEYVKSVESSGVVSFPIHEPLMGEPDDGLEEYRANAAKQRRGADKAEPLK